MTNDFLKGMTVVFFFFQKRIFESKSFIIWTFILNLKCCFCKHIAAADAHEYQKSINLNSVKLRFTNFGDGDF